ncbi:MAG: hypothetical protein P8R54_11550 [Myxococcota bacterium]|nr:hypothetical protein [Myxococcota bacterium]
MERMVLLAWLMLTGCSASVAGDWVGVCSFSPAGGYPAEMEVSAEIWTDNGRNVEGRMTIADWTGAGRTSDLIGSHTGRYVFLQSSFLSERGDYVLEIDAEKSGRQMDGECAFMVPEGEGALIGDAELAR